MKKRINKLNKKGALALSQIFILIVSIVAVSWAIGSQIGVVSGVNYGSYPYWEDENIRYYVLSENLIHKVIDGNFNIAYSRKTNSAGLTYWQGYTDEDLNNPYLSEDDLPAIYPINQGTAGPYLERESKAALAAQADEPICGNGIVEGNEVCDGGTNCISAGQTNECTCPPEFPVPDGNEGCKEEPAPPPIKLPPPVVTTPTTGGSPFLSSLAAQGLGVIQKFSDFSGDYLLYPPDVVTDVQAVYGPGGKYTQDPISGIWVTDDGLKTLPDSISNQVNEALGISQTGVAQQPRTTPTGEPSPEDGEARDWGKLRDIVAIGKDIYDIIERNSVHAGLIYTGIRTGAWAGEAMGWWDADFSNAVANTAFLTKLFAGSIKDIAIYIAGKAGWGTIEAVIGSTLFSVIYYPVVFAGIFNKLYAKTDTGIVTFTCKTWQPQTGGKNCELCNKNNPLGYCTEYQCRSMGQACELINIATDEQKCVWIDKDDINPPVIQPWEDALFPKYNYVPARAISPPDTGVIVEYNESEDGCAPSNTVFSFGITLDKRGQCRMDTTRKSFEEMDIDFGDSVILKENHTQYIVAPGLINLEQSGYEVPNGGYYDIYVKCKSANGYATAADFVFQFCINQEADTTAPIMYGTNWINGAPIAFFREDEAHEVNVELYTDETAECKWDHQDKAYDEMKNNLTMVGDDISSINALLSYTHTATLTGLENGKENKFYFKCRDMPELKDTDKENERNTNTDSFELTLIGTQPLVIISAEPNATTIRGATDSIKVTLEAQTSAGYSQGEATCGYGHDGTRYDSFDQTDSYQHSTNIWLDAGDYGYYIRCFDLAGNVDTEQINFDVEKDTSAPMVVRAYHEENYLTIITDEEASCVYNTQLAIECNYIFEDGNSMISIDDTVHFTTWDKDKTFYIKCKDEYENQPDPDKCSIIARPFEI